MRTTAMSSQRTKTRESCFSCQQNSASSRSRLPSSVNKRIGSEALETFYNRKTVRLTFEQLYEDRWADYQDFLRNVEVIDCVDAFRSGSVTKNSALIRASLSIALNLPRLKSVTFLSDGLAYIPERPGAATVREWVNDLGLDGLLCEDVGLYKLHGQYAGVKIANSKLRKMWPNVASTPEDYDALRVVRKITNRWRISGDIADPVAWASQTSLRVWVGLWERLIDFRKGAEPSPLSSAGGSLSVQGYFELGSWAKTVKTSPVVPKPGRDNLVPLHTLGRQHDPQTLEWATELLAATIETHKTDDGEDAKSCWPEVDGCEGIGAQQAKAKNWGRDPVDYESDEDDEDDHEGFEDGCVVC